MQSKKLKGDGDVPLPRFGHSADSFNNLMFVFGGWNGFNTLDEVYSFSLG